jgi:hypothetical protein
VSDGLEGWHRDQEAKPQIENQIALEKTYGSIRTLKVARWDDCLPPEQISHDEQRKERVNQRGQEHPAIMGSGVI